MTNYRKLYTPQDSAVVFIDHQPQMTFGVTNIDRASLINNVTLLGKVAKVFPDLAKRVIAGALERKLIVLSAGTYGNVTRIIPPLVTTAAEVDLALRILEESVVAAAA